MWNLGLAMFLEATYEDAQWGDDPFSDGREEWIDHVYQSFLSVADSSYRKTLQKNMRRVHNIA